MKELGRLITAMVTPFNKEGEVDYDQAKKLALALLKSGSEGVVLAGTTGDVTLRTDGRMYISQVGQNGYRYGFNGKEKDDDWTGTTGATYDYGFRIYDSRIGKFLSVDPLTGKYP